MFIWGNVRILVIHGHRCVVFRLLRVSLMLTFHSPDDLSARFSHVTAYCCVFSDFNIDRRRSA